MRPTNSPVAPVAIWLLLLAAAAYSPCVRAHDVISTRLTWSQEVSRIVLKRCGACHREGGPAPMALLTYAQARPWAKAIKEEVLERRMPPWGAVKGFGDFADDPSLTPEELHVIADWVEGGAPEGDPQYLPAAGSPPAATTKPPALPAARLTDGQRLAAPARLTAIAPPATLARGASFQAIAELPGGAREPLLWVVNFQPKHRRAFAYRSPVVLPAGTRIRLSEPGAAIAVRIGAAATIRSAK